MYFQYGQEETEYLSGKDEKLGAVIAQVGRVNREVDTDLFSAVVHHIVGQQISTKAQATIWQRMRGALGTVDAEHILEAGNEQLQLLGISCRKAEYITDFARKIQNGEFDLEGIWQKPDEEVIRELSALKGIGVWTAEMILLFCMQRPDVFSYDDLAIQRGLRMVYHHRKIDRKLFEKYRRRFSPYCSVASLYLWAAAGGAVDVPVVAAARRERDAAYGYLLGGEHIQITGAVKVRGKGGVLRPCVEGAGAVELFQCHGAISSPARRIFHLRLFAPILSRAGLTGKRRFCTMVSTKSLNRREERPCSTPNWPPLSAWPTAAASARRRKSSTSRPRR